MEFVQIEFAVFVGFNPIFCGIDALDGNYFCSAC